MLMELILTDDGSHTLFLPELDETYHSTKGAVAEAMHVYIKTGLKIACANNLPIRILEMGFGTGLNAMLTYLHSPVPIHYESLDTLALSKEWIASLNYADKWNDEQNSVFQKMHDAPWNEEITMSPDFILLKLEEDILIKKFIPEQYDLVYFDAFGPKVQPELWTECLMRNMYNAMKPEGILVSYCAQGQWKRNLKAAGFEVEELRGPAGRKEITRAIKRV